MLEEIKNKAIIDKIPIMQDEGIEFLTNYIKNNNVKQILEIGTAVGYSSIKMALINKNINITTIERDELRYKEAIANITKMNLNNQIKCIKGDALEIELNDKYDLIFIDASKGHSIDFFNNFKNNLVIAGTIVTDNLSFHGLVEDETKAVTKNQKGLVKRIKKFISFLDNNEEFSTTYIMVGDKISISKRKTQNL